MCGIDWVTGLNQDGDPANDVDVANMSLGDSGTLGTALDGGLREAICRRSAPASPTSAAAGNSSVDASTFIPAAFPEVITVSALADFDGEPGGLGGCRFVLDLFWYDCDDQWRSSPTTARDRRHAPGVRIYSTWTGGGYNTIERHEHGHPARRRRRRAHEGGEPFPHGGRCLACSPERRMPERGLGRRRWPPGCAGQGTVAR